MQSDNPRLTVLPAGRTGPRDRPTLLLTGGSGVLGRALIDELSAEYDLLCLRRNTPLRDPRVRELEGDLVAPRLGLSPRAWHELALQVDVVLHSAAETNWRTPPENITRTNLRGADTVLDLAARADAPLYLMSTAFVANTPTEEDRRRFPGAAAYLDSKSRAEQLMRDAGVPGAIVRPSVVMGDSATGRIAGQQGLTKTIGSMVLGQVPVLPGAPDARIDMVPQDYVARAVGDLVRGGVGSGEYWLTAGKEAIELREFADVCADVAVHHGLPRPQRPRLIPVEAVHRLLLPMLEGTALPASVRRRLEHYAELLLVFQRELPFDTSLGTPDCGTRLTRGDIRAALVRNAESWAEGRSGLLGRHRAAATAPTGVAS
ncbi:SDR family oxidoreductase [Streptomyces olivaceus]|uniref:SDR family oxidoreductase n=1 Tax=Streptomyces TaxID=1883 RepID=UPI001CCFDDD3|nr:MULTISPECIES: SDR family oxidoreductase [Streptomyces]MBZ6141727.1 SDR family oxidoreductase [Streptomyces olivaceus]MBZ6169605.1 SDR family oxidoreductase [Streptomyces olivaceus]MBZ6259942.1 SDR family oxidoreductase [Streptomyces olivaceus]WFB82707.1 SDR family oxidoreductase [Streptomyces olivaceus]WGK45006.1 SDR family oxidoreductase [Streptomyces sp. B146]